MLPGRCAASPAAARVGGAAGPAAFPSTAARGRGVGVQPGPLRLLDPGLAVWFRRRLRRWREWRPVRCLGLAGGAGGRLAVTVRGVAAAAGGHGLRVAPAARRGVQGVTGMELKCVMASIVTVS